MKRPPPDGTRYSFPQESILRLKLIETLRHLFDGWGYEPVDVPVLEHYDPAHPAAGKSFKLADAGSGVLALRADYTPAIARLVSLHYPEAAGEAPTPQRFQYAGKLWHAVQPDIARTREFTQVGIELVGVSNARADAELVHLAREAVRAVGLAPRVEVGNPGFVRELFTLADVPHAAREALADAIDRKDERTLRETLAPLGVHPELERAILGVPDLYGATDVTAAARRLAPWPETARELDRLEAVVGEFEDATELLLDLGMARRLAYYTGITFRAYTFDFGQPLLGGGRYDGALLPYAAGFAIGLERLLRALPAAADADAPLVVSLHDPLARRLRANGIRVERALAAGVDEVRAYAKRRGIPYVLLEDGVLEPQSDARPLEAELDAALSGAAPSGAAPSAAAPEGAS